MNKLSPQAPLDENSEDTVPLTNYVLVLVAWWREIVLGTFLVAIGCGIALLAVRTFLPRYDASSYVTILRVTSNVAIDKRFSTGATADDQASSRRRGLTERNARRAGLVGLVRSGNVARAVAERLSGKLDKKYVSAARLLERIDAELVTVGTLSMRNSSDLIRITARADSPEASAFIADAWAEEYVDEVNRLYRHTPANQLELILTEMQRTQEAYDVAQKELETFLVNSNVEKLNSILVSKQEAATHLHAFQRETFKKALFSREQNLERRTYAVNLSTEAERERLETSYALRKEAGRLLENAVDFRAQIEAEETENPISDLLPLIMLKASVYTPSNDLSKSLEIDFGDLTQSPVDNASILAEIDQLILILKNRIEAHTSSITTQSEKLLNFAESDIGRMFEDGSGNRIGHDNGSPSSRGSSWLLRRAGFIVTENSSAPFQDIIDDLEDQIQSLKAEIETANATRENLVQNRDVHRATLETLRNEVAELKLAMAAFTSEVRVASLALVPAAPTYPSMWLISGLGWVAGLVATVSLAFSLNFAQIPPPLGKRRAARPGRTRVAG